MGLGYLFAGKFGGIKVKEVEGENTPCWNIMVNTTLKIDFSRWAAFSHQWCCAG